MPYGRLDVFFPDGMVKSYLLNDESISLGRSPGNTIPLDTDTISRYHMSITRQGEATFVTDLESANGTFVDGTRLPTNAPQQLLGGEEILIGELIMIFQEFDQSSTRPVDVPEDLTQHVQSGEANFSIDVEAPEIAFSPGTHATARVRVTNASSNAERFIIEISGVPRDWVRMDRPDLELGAGEDDEAVISFKPPRHPDSVPGNYRVLVSVRPKGQTEIRVTAEMLLRILAFSSFGMALDRRQVAAGGSLRLHLHNQGSSILTLALGGRSVAIDGGGRAPKLRFLFTPPQVALMAGERQVVNVQVKPRWRLLFGTLRRVTFDLQVRSSDPSGFLVAARGYMTEQARFPGWAAPIAAAAAGGAALALIALLLLLLAPPPPPGIARFAPGVEGVLQGEPLPLAFSVSNADALALSANGTPVATYAGDASSGVLDTAGLQGAVALELAASGAGGTALATASVFIDAPFTVSAFTIAPQPLVLHVRQPITLSWNIPDATIVRLTGGGAFGTFDLPASGERTFDFTPEDPNFALQITATNAAGETVQQLVTVQTVNPVCLPDGPVQIYNAPGETAPVIASASPGEQMIVDARDASGEWLRMPLVGGVWGWAPLARLNCVGNFNPAALTVDSNPPPLPSATPSKTPTPSATPAPPTLTLTPAATLTPMPTLTPTPSPAVTVPPGSGFITATPAGG
jgi:hypothetical protein